MTTLYGRPQSDLSARLTSLRHVCRIDRFVEEDGPERGARRFRMINGGGLEVDLHPDRGLDIGAVTYRGVPLAWGAAAGIIAPWFYDPHGDGWLRTFGGGMLTTCGLETFGPPSEDQGREYGQHGRYSAIPARVESAIEGPDELVVAGSVRQSAHFGECFLLRRTVRTTVGSSTFRVEDRVINCSPNPQPHMFMYHVNIGWPLLDTDVTVTADPGEVTAREGGDVGKHDWAVIEESTAQGSDRVWLHSYAERPPVRDVVVANERLGLSLALSYSADTLPWLCEWKSLTDNAYVLGIEPVNTPTMQGRADARERGVLPMLAPGESVDYWVEITIADLT